MTEFEQYKKGYSPSAIQRKYGLTYPQGYEIAQDYKKIFEQLQKTISLIKDGRFVEALQLLERK